MSSLLFGRYACVFDTGHCPPSEEQMIYTLFWGNLADKNFFSEGPIGDLLRAKGTENPLSFPLREVRCALPWESSIAAQIYHAKPTNTICPSCSAPLDGYGPWVPKGAEAATARYGAHENNGFREWRKANEMERKEPKLGGNKVKNLSCLFRSKMSGVQVSPTRTVLLGKTT